MKFLFNTSLIKGKHILQIKYFLIFLFILSFSNISRIYSLFNFSIILYKSSFFIIKFNLDNPNNRGPNGDPQFPYYYNEVKGKSRKDTFNRALNNSYGNQPINHGNHFHASRMRGGQLFKFGNTHYTW